MGQTDFFDGVLWAARECLSFLFLNFSFLFNQLILKQSEVLSFLYEAITLHIYIHVRMSHRRMQWIFIVEFEIGHSRNTCDFVRSLNNFLFEILQYMHIIIYIYTHWWQHLSAIQYEVWFVVRFLSFSIPIHIYDWNMKRRNFQIRFLVVTDSCSTRCCWHKVISSIWILYVRLEFECLRWITSQMKNVCFVYLELL